MFIRILRLLITKIQSLFLNSLSFTSRIEYSHVSRKAKIWGHCTLNHASVGDYTYIGRNMRVIHAHIGKFCSIAGDGAIGMGTHSLKYLSTSPIFTSRKNAAGHQWTQLNNFEEYKEITIGHDVWIGQRVMIMGGVNIGNGAVIGAGAVVTKDIPPYAIVGGVPAKIIRFRFAPDIIEQIEASQWWTLDDKLLKNNITIFQEPLKESNLSKLFALANHCR